MQQGDEDKKRSLGGELIIPIAAIVFSLYYFTTILDSPWTAQVSAFFVGAVLIALSAAFVIRCAVAVRGGRADLGLGGLFSRADLTSGRLALLVVTLGYILTIEWAGFTITTFVFLFAGMLALNRGRRPGLIAALAAIMALGGYLLFILAFDTRFPRGPFETFMKAMLGDGG
jgi:hypothetical protein